ncbi:uncharacterized protein LOC142332484 [Lycorma delicatula]|uniref:uncharacterized protein LOC142332484 n=1 Tax=Lycorma delicatula TaxID=130591 RepID=UPI003F50EB07
MQFLSDQGKNDLVNLFDTNPSLMNDEIENLFTLFEKEKLNHPDGKWKERNINDPNKASLKNFLEKFDLPEDFVKYFMNSLSPDGEQIYGNWSNVYPDSVQSYISNFKTYFDDMPKNGQPNVRSIKRIPNQGEVNTSASNFARTLLDDNEYPKDHIDNYISCLNNQGQEDFLKWLKGDKNSARELIDRFNKYYQNRGETHPNKSGDKTGR